MVEKLWWQTLNLNPIMMTTHALADHDKEPIQNIILRTSLLTLCSCKIMSLHLILLHEYHYYHHYFAENRKVCK